MAGNTFQTGGPKAAARSSGGTGNGTNEIGRAHV